MLATFFHKFQLFYKNATEHSLVKMKMPRSCFPILFSFSLFCSFLLLFFVLKMKMRTKKANSNKFSLVSSTKNKKMKIKYTPCFQRNQTWYVDSCLKVFPKMFSIGSRQECLHDILIGW